METLAYLVSLLAPVSTHWFLFALFAILVLGMTGVIGRGLGLQNVFHEDPELASRYKADHGNLIYWNSPKIFGQAATVAFLALLWGFAYTLEHGAQHPPGGGSFGTVLALQVILTTPVCLAAGMIRFTDAVGPFQSGERFRCLLGAAIGLVAALGILGAGFAVAAALIAAFPGTARWMPTVGLALPAAGVTATVLWHRKQLPVLALVCLLAALAIAYALVSVFPGSWQLPVVLLILVLAVLINVVIAPRLRGDGPVKFRIPGLVTADGEDHYAPGNLLILTEPGAEDGQEDSTLGAIQAWKEQAAAAPETPPPDAAKLDPLDALKAWHDRVAGLAGPKPKLVLLATSGGAYRAGYWTGLVLDRLRLIEAEGDLTGFRDNVRLISGASGGMVAGAYYTALARDDGEDAGPVLAQLNADILAAQAQDTGTVPFTTRFPIPRDSLSPVAQQLAQRDVPRLFWPFPPKGDRGTVLEDQWITLDTSFKDWMPGEAEGWRPSIIFSPMLVETGQPLLIGNLDMDQIRDDRYRETVEFFDWFPHSRESFRVKTAVRMNASFPYVSPDAALPTDPYRRVVDAGYYDNYGGDLAVAYLSQPRLMDWILTHCSGVALVQFRAFPDALPGRKQPGAFKRGFQWLTTPLEGLLVARGSTMRFRNRQSLRRVQRLYADRAGRDFICNTVFQADAKTSMNWYLPGRELEELRGQLAHETNAESFQRLVDFWSST